MPKPKEVSLRLEFGFPPGHNVRKASIAPDGKITFSDALGLAVIPEYMERALQFPRQKAPKIQVKHRLDGDLATIGGLAELTKFDSVFVIDTNRRTINGKDVHAACFIRCQFIQQKDNSVQVVCDEEKVNFYELHNATQNPELLAILKVAHDVSGWPNFKKTTKLAFVTDSSLGAHNDICARKIPIYGQHFLPPRFSLLYASSDTGREVINKLIRFCDHQATKYLNDLEQGTVPSSDLHALPEDTSVMHRYVCHTGLEIVNSVAKGISLQAGSTLQLYGVRK